LARSASSSRPFISHSVRSSLYRAPAEASPPARITTEPANNSVEVDAPGSGEALCDGGRRHDPVVDIHDRLAGVPDPSLSIVSSDRPSPPRHGQIVTMPEQLRVHLWRLQQQRPEASEAAVSTRRPPARRPQPIETFRGGGIPKAGRSANRAHTS